MTKTRCTALSTVVLALVASACSSDGGGNNGVVATGGAGIGGAAGNPAAGGAPSGGAPLGGAPSGGASSGGASSGGAPGSGGTNQGTGGALVGGAGAGTTGGTSNGGSGGASGGGGVSSGGASGAGTGGAATGGAGTGGAATGGAGGGANPGVDLTGTWISEVKTSGKLTVPIVGMSDADIDLVIRLSLTKAGDKLNGAFNICRLTTTTTPDPNTLKVTFTPAVIATLATTVSENDFTAAVGQPVPVPDIRILSGMDSASKSVDADNDTHPGVTVPSNIANGLIVLNAYTGLDIKVSLTSTLTDANTISGTTKFSTAGTVFGSDNIILTSGDINVTPASNAVPFTAKKLAGDVACAEVLKNFP